MTAFAAPQTSTSAARRFFRKISHDFHAAGGGIYLLFLCRAYIMEHMNLSKLTESFPFPTTFDDFSAPRNVQSCFVRALDNATLIESGGRFKRFASPCERILILKGNGHFKYKRGELPFSEGEAFAAEGLEEYDFYGEGTFLIVKV